MPLGTIAMVCFNGFIYTVSNSYVPICGKNCKNLKFCYHLHPLLHVNDNKFASIRYCFAQLSYI